MNGGVEGGDDGESASMATAVSSMVTVGVERVSEAMVGRDVRSAGLVQWTRALSKACSCEVGGGERDRGRGEKERERELSRRARKKRGW